MTGTWLPVPWNGVRVTNLVDHSMDLVLVAGVRDGLACVAVMGLDGPTYELELPEALAAAGPVSSLCFGEGALGVCGETALWRWAGGQLTAVDVPLDESGRPPRRLWVTAGDDELRATGVYPVQGGLEFRVLTEDLSGLNQRTSGLLLQGDLEQVRVAAWAGRVAISGPVGPVGSDGQVSVWSTRAVAEAEFEGESELPEWWPADEPIEADTVTDGQDWDATAFFAGTIGGRAALWDAEGDRSDFVPEGLALDAERPWLRLAEGPEYDEPALAAGTPDGSVLLYAGSSYAMPAGEIGDVVLNRGTAIRCFAVVDGHLQVLTLD